MNLSEKNKPTALLTKLPLWAPVKKLLRKVFRPRSEMTTLDVLQTFPAFRPYSPGHYLDRVKIATRTINQTVPLLGSLAHSLGARKLTAIDIHSFPSSSRDLEASDKLRTCCERHGSDKASGHDYHFFYGPVLGNRGEIRGLLEIGLGTNNINVVSHMGRAGKPGASLRAFKDFLGSARIYGADIDREILFQEDRIETFFVDQTDPTSFAELSNLVPSGLDMVIDDGLHSPDENVATLSFGLSKARVGGWVVIEDIGADALPIWDLVSAILPDRFETRLYEAKGAFLFAVRRIS